MNPTKHDHHQAAAAPEALEARTLFAVTPVTASIVDDTLVILGTRKADRIYLGLGGTADVLVVRTGTAGAVLGSFDRAAAPCGVFVFGGAGSDRLIIDSSARLPAVLLGGGGNDWLVGGPGDDVIDGGPGRDRLLGGDGDDLLDGGPASDHLDGGAGNDSLCGGAGKDLCTGGAGADLFDEDLPPEVLDKDSDEILTGPVVIVVE